MTDQSSSATEHDVMDEVRVAVASLTAPWTVGQLARAADIDPGTARACTERLVEGGTIEELGEDPRHDGDGPAPRLYGPRPVADSLEDKDVTLG